MKRTCKDLERSKNVGEITRYYFSGPVNGDLVCVIIGLGMENDNGGRGGMRDCRRIGTNDKYRPQRDCLVRRELTNTVVK